MRTNLPITQRELELEAGCTLVSVTDPKGIIQYCNPAFIAVSGYRSDELIGQPHNLIRHPDMPAEAFRDMWETVKAGVPWSGVVKNRRANGDHYWVRANVTPVLDGDRVAGYMSVRTVPTRQEVDEAQRLYAQMVAEQGGSSPRLRLDGGERVPLHVWGRSVRYWRRHDGLALSVYCGLPPLIGLSVLAVAALHGAPSAPVWWGAAGAALGSSVFAAHRIRRSWIAPLEAIYHHAHRMAGGDLSSSLSVRHPGVIGKTERALQQLSVNLRAIVNGTREGVDVLNHAAQELAQGGQDLCTRTEVQSADVQQSASSLEQITGTVKQSAEAARNLASFARQAEGVTSHTAEAVQEVTQTMSAINESSHRVRDISQVIDGIAFQTNILALNAAVEAARAGEQGRGFAVVAGEVRALAQRCSGAAREIRQLIEGTVERIEVGAQQTAAARTSMDEALAAVQSMGRLVGEIDLGSSEQSAALAQVHNAVEHIDGITQQNAALVEELAASAESVRIQTQAVSETVQMFRLG